MAGVVIRGTTGAKSLLRRMGHPNTDPQDAVRQGLLVAEKIVGNWAYAEDSAHFQLARESMVRSVESVCRDWFVVPLPVLVNTANKRDKVSDMEFTVARALVREFIRSGHVGSLPMLTTEYNPYFSVFSLEDQVEVDRQIDTVREWIIAGGRFRTGDLPFPNKPRSGEAWRDCILAHAEFLGFGSWEDGWFLANRVPR